MAKSAMSMIGKVCKNPYFSFLNFLVFQQGLSLLGFFCFYIFGSSERFGSDVGLPSFLSIGAIAPLLICFVLNFKTVFSKIATFLSYNCIYVSFIILQQIFVLFNFLLVFCNLISVKILMISCFQTLV